MEIFDKHALKSSGLTRTEEYQLEIWKTQLEMWKTQFEIWKTQFEIRQAKTEEYIRSLTTLGYKDPLTRFIEACPVDENGIAQIGSSNVGTDKPN